MRPTPESELEQAIDRELRSLPELRAPLALEVRVMRAIAEREARPWWRKDFGAWPWYARATFLMGSGALAAFLGYFAWGMLAGISVGTLGAEARDIASQWNLPGGTLTALWGAMGSLCRSASPGLVWGGLGVLGACYLTTFALGTACYRLVSQRI